MKKIMIILGFLVFNPLFVLGCFISYNGETLSGLVLVGITIVMTLAIGDVAKEKDLVQSY